MSYEILPPDSRRIVATCLNPQCPRYSIDNEYDGNYLIHPDQRCGVCKRSFNVRQVFPWWQFWKHDKVIQRGYVYHSDTVLNVTYPTETAYTNLPADSTIEVTMPEKERA